MEAEYRRVSQFELYSRGREDYAMSTNTASADTSKISSAAQFGTQITALWYVITTDTRLTLLTKSLYL